MNHASAARGGIPNSVGILSAANPSAGILSVSNLRLRQVTPASAPAQLAVTRPTC
ncbi:MAG: hypothetical protein H7248_00590 [Microbacteriaceae bacterium]|nr:hypothetical protein [Microbacteriaceae bacterium]